MLRVKICGITSSEDADLAIEAGADALGFNFYPKSPRYLPFKKAKEIIRALPPLVSRVGLFVNPSQGEVEQALGLMRLDWLQFHGDEEPDFVARFPADLVIKAARIRTRKDLGLFKPFLRSSALLLDAAAPGLYGGSGKRFPWEIAKEAKRRFRRPIILAGGLDADNVAEAVSFVQPWAVDVASGVESHPGKKDKKKLKAFIAAAKAAAR